MINENIINISIVYMLYSAYIEWPFSNLRLFDDIRFSEKLMYNYFCETKLYKRKKH